jgi:hypothetical protein
MERDQKGQHASSVIPILTGALRFCKEGTEVSLCKIRQFEEKQELAAAGG